MYPNQTLIGIQSRILEKLSKIFSTYNIDATLVQGDTMTVFCGALASYYNKIPIFYVEAGLRSYDLFEPFPEEAIRQMTTRIAELHFAPTTKAVEALERENILRNKIILTGNTVIDALSCLPEDVLDAAMKNLIKKGILLNDKLVLITVHRRENHGLRLDNILDSIIKLSTKYFNHQFVLPVHPNPNVKEKIYNKLSNFHNVILTKPLDYPELVTLMKHTKLVITDSGGIQEEAPTFGNPILVMRYETERMEGVDAGFAKLVGADREKIFFHASKILDIDKSCSRITGIKNPYGDGKATVKILSEIQRFFEKGK